MKLLGMVLVSMMAAAGAWAQAEVVDQAVAATEPAVQAAAAVIENATAEAAGEAPIKITDTEATTIVRTINGYMQGPTHRGRLQILDRKKGQLVSLRLDRLITDDPERVVFPAEGQIAVCGACTEMIKGDQGETEGDAYEVWFLVQRGDMVSSRVLDTFVKSVNGVQMYKWTKDPVTGNLSATLAVEPN
jgi:hypothetical protein